MKVDYRADDLDMNLGINTDILDNRDVCGRLKMRTMAFRDDDVTV